MRLNYGTAFVVIVDSIFFVFSIVDHLANLGFGLSQGMWVFLIVIILAPLFWVFNTGINKLILAYARHNYGPDPDD